MPLGSREISSMLNVFYLVIVFVWIYIFYNIHIGLFEILFSMIFESTNASRAHHASFTMCRLVVAMETVRNGRPFDEPSVYRIGLRHFMASNLCEGRSSLPRHDISQYLKGQFAI